MRVLLVEDEPLLADTVAEALRREGFAVDVANDGIHGLHQSGSPSTTPWSRDVMLPGVSGPDLLRDLRDREVRERSSRW